ncbi:MAG: CHAT domain-containing protein, partial [Acidimicrobiales bacterium]|nr:CHAT domain-containing protein [Acidimicrobiales bacterium]
TLVAGPHLPGAAAEVTKLAELYADAHVLVGPDATAGNVLAAFERSDVVHLAAHGSFRSDSPLFSSVLLADGPLTVYDLERVHAAPTIVVLSACDAAAAVVRTGDELLGTATALLGLGVRSVVAPVLAIPDEATVGVMVAVHQRLRAGQPVGAALAGAVTSHRAAASSFVCIGRDEEASAEQG